MLFRLHSQVSKFPRQNNHSQSALVASPLQVMRRAILGFSAPLTSVCGDIHMLILAGIAALVVLHLFDVLLTIRDAMRDRTPL
jgi:hypothetical protein